uniref:cell wall protein RBR3-like n=1 Tax=Erigeron canadensis TaxID=72917 RepID=UPI001CB9C144|nr:cell wall protein RBR3-like [Erigeron canadensis]
MPASPGMRFSPGRERRGANHERGRSSENGIGFKERDDDNLALFHEMHCKETENFLLQSNDNFEDNFVTMRNFSDHKLGINTAARGESSNLLNAEEEKNDYEWLMTPPDTPLFPSLDDEAPQIIHEQRGRPRTQPISFSRSSTMEKSRRSSRGSASPNRLSPSPRSRQPEFQPRNRASSVPSSSPPPSQRPATGSRRPSSPSSKPSTPPPRASTPPSRRLSTGSVTTSSTGPRGISGNSVSPKIRAWQANIPGFSTEAPPNLRTSLADRPASYVRGSSPASRNRRQSMSPVASRSIGSFHSHDRDRSSSYSKGSIASSADDDVESLRSIIVEGSERSSLRKVGGFRDNKAPISHKPIRTVSSSSAPKRSFDMALRQMDHRKGPQNMFRPLLSSVPSTNFYAGKGGPAPAWNSSVTTSSNASSDFATSGPLDIEENEQHKDDATSGYDKALDHDLDEDELFMLEEPESENEDMGNEMHGLSPNGDGLDSLVQCDTAACVVSDDFIGNIDFPEIDSIKDMLSCSRCGCEYSSFTLTQDDIKLCPNCRKSTSSLTISDLRTSLVVVTSSLEELPMSDEYHELVNTMKPQTTLVKLESPEVTSETEAQSKQHKYVIEDGESTPAEQSQHTFDYPGSLSPPRLEECEPTEANDQVISQPSLSFSDERDEQTQHTIDFPKTTVNSVEGIPVVLKRSTNIKGYVICSGNFSASSISFDDLSYVRGSTNSMRSSIGRGSVSASSSADFGPRFHRQMSNRKSDIDNYNYDPMNVKYRRSVSSLSGTSSHAFPPSSVGTSTFDSFEASIVPMERDVADSSSVGPQETQSEHDTYTKDDSVINIETALDSEEVLLTESSNNEEPTSFPKVDDLGKDPSTSTTCTFEKVEDLGKDSSALVTCTFEKVEDLGKGTSALTTHTFENTNFAEVQLDAISERELDQTCSASPASQCSLSQSSESGIKEIQDPHVSTALGKDTAASAIECDTSNHSNSIMEESTVLVEGQGGTKGRSLTLEEATDTILFCSSIVHNLAYEAATIAIDKATLPDFPDNDNPFPLTPAVPYGYTGNKDDPAQKTSKGSSKSQKTRQKKTMEKNSTKDPNRMNICEETVLPKTRIVYPSNKENTRPPKLESKCNCVIM